MSLRMLTPFQRKESRTALEHLSALSFYPFHPRSCDPHAIILAGEMAQSKRSMLQIHQSDNVDMAGSDYVERSTERKALFLLGSGCKHSHQRIIPQNSRNRRTWPPQPPAAQSLCSHVHFLPQSRSLQQAWMPNRRLKRYRYRQDFCLR